MSCDGCDCDDSDELAGLWDTKVTIKRPGSTLASDGAGSDVNGADTVVASDVDALVVGKTLNMSSNPIGGGLPATLYWQVFVPLGTDIQRGDTVVTARGRSIHLEKDITPEGEVAVARGFYGLEQEA